MIFLQSKYQDALSTAYNTHTFGVCYEEAGLSDSKIHIHDCCTVLLCLSPAKSILIDDRIYSVDSGDLFIINQFEPYKIATNTNNDFKKFILYIHPEYLTANSTQATNLSQCFCNRDSEFSHKISLSDEEITQIQKHLIRFRIDNGFGDDIIKNSSINNLLVFINQLFLNKPKSKSENSEQSEAIQNIVSYVTNHISEPITLELLAKNSFISVNQLCKIFKNTFGTTVAKYIVSKRISQAKKLLSSGNSVADTALSCGFYDYANFIRVFKKTVGVSPGKYGRL